MSQTESIDERRINDLNYEQKLKRYDQQRAQVLRQRHFDNLLQSTTKGQLQPNAKAKPQKKLTKHDKPNKNHLTIKSDRLCPNPKYPRRSLHHEDRTNIDSQWTKHSSEKRSQPKPKTSSTNSIAPTKMLLQDLTHSETQDSPVTELNNANTHFRNISAALHTRSSLTSIILAQLKTGHAFLKITLNDSTYRGTELLLYAEKNSIELRCLKYSNKFRCHLNQQSQELASELNLRGYILNKITFE